MVIQAIASLLLAPVQSGPLAEIPFRIGERAIIVDSMVNGKQVSCMFDTGFSGAYVIGPHIDLGKPTGKMGLKDFVGVFEADTIKVNDLRLGALNAEHAEMQIVQMPTLDFTESYGQHVDGIMGLEVFAPYVTEINFAQKKFIVHPPTYDISQRTPDNQKTFLVRMLPIGHNSIELAVRASTGKQLVLALDTGNAFYATTHKDVLERVGLWSSGKQPQFMSQSWVASGPVDSWSIMLNDMTIFGVPVKESVWDIIDLPASDAQHDGTVGFGFLKHFNITIDLKRRRIWLENHSGRTTDDHSAEVGISATYSPRDQRMVIVNVTPNSPAAKAGIKRGDFLISIGEETLTKTTFRHVEEMQTGEVGTEVELSVSTGGQLRRVKLVRELLVNKPG